MRISRAQIYLFQAFAILSLTSLGLFGLRVQLTDTTRYYFIPGNLLLAWAGLLLGWNLARRMAKQSWSSWPVWGSAVLWLFFLPNTWYTLTDFLHVFPTGEISELFDITLMSSFVWCCFLMGLTSLYLVHKQLLKRFSARQAYSLAQAAILLASFAIYLGRVLRWNSWDVLTNPSGLLINVGDRLVDPLAHPSAINITGLFFIFISLTYCAFWRATKIARSL